MSEIEQKIDDLTAAIRQLGDVRNEANEKAADADGGRYAAALDASKAVADQLVALNRDKAEADAAKEKAARKAEIDAAVREILANTRTPSMASVIGNGSAVPQGRSTTKAHAFLSGSLGNGYEAGRFLHALMGYKGQLSDGINVEEITASKAQLEQWGVAWQGPSPYSKATLGATNATGGYVLPNNVVETLVKPKTQAARYRDLVSITNGVAVRGVDQPYRLGAPTRMTTADWGATKENVNESYGSYTASLVTFARVYDISKQYARFSAGSAEADVLDELMKAADLAENFAVIAGPGSGSVGSGDATLGIYTSLNATPTFIGYKGAFSSASNSTVAGSFANACTSLMASLAGRNRAVEAIVVDHTTYFTAIGQGADAAGFWVNPAGGPTGFTRTANGELSFWGVPIYYDTNLGTNAATKIAIGAQWSAFRLYRGLEFRIDSSDVAGTRWDQNLIGFRGEMELGFNAETPVHTGAAQLLTAVIP